MYILCSDEKQVNTQHQKKGLERCRLHTLEETRKEFRTWKYCPKLQEESRTEEGGKETGVLAMESGALASSHAAQLQTTGKWK